MIDSRLLRTALAIPLMLLAAGIPLQNATAAPRTVLLELYAATW